MVPIECAPVLRWNLGDGLTLLVKPDCEGGGRGMGGVGLVDVPDTKPEATCGYEVGAQPLEVTRGPPVNGRPGEFRVRLGPSPVRVRIEGADPADCKVLINRTAAQLVEDRFLGSAKGEVPVWASCNGRPARPEMASPELPDVVVEWVAEGPELDLSEWLQGRPAALHYVGEDGEQLAVLPLSPNASGRTLLPPLEAGLFQVLIGNVPLLAARDPREQGAPGSLVLHRVSGGLVGTLSLVSDMRDGIIAVVPPSKR
jgi:hypothetical protein